MRRDARNADPGFTDRPVTAMNLTIGRLAQAAGVGVDTVRFYERSGLLPRPHRRASGYRTYDADDVRRLRFIRRAKALGFSLEEIAELLSLERRRGEATARAKAVAARKLVDVELKIAELSGLQAALQALVQACPGEGAPECCPILRSLSESQEARR